MHLQNHQEELQVSLGRRENERRNDKAFQSLTRWLRIVVLLVGVGFTQVSALAHDEKDAENLVRAYSAAVLNLDWESFVKMSHPKALEKMRNGVFAKVSLPKKSADINESNRDSLDGFLTLLSVKTPEEAWALPPEVVCITILRQSGDTNAAKSIRDVKSEIEGVSVKKEGDGYRVSVDLRSEFRGKVVRAYPIYIVEPVDGVLKVVGNQKDKLPPKDK